MSRRAFLTGSVVLLGGVAAVSKLSGRSSTPAPSSGAPSHSPLVDPSAPPGSAVRSLDEVLAEAEATAGRRLLASPWSSWSGSTSEAWSGIYVSWLLRDNGVTRTADVAGLHAVFQAGNSLGSEPEPGALIFYSRGPVSPPHHVGLVTSVTRGVPQTQEGDHPFSLPYAERFVRRFARPWDDRVSYAYPSYR
ncbi:CHAP domain-containing protein [Geodermatophilus sp. DF01-2]|uniref:C40 family peptidase n=1 Tax=Geodermatophilus sp. DF01-2 TaxID=2559610 RepID=UPI00107423CC|nr:CHAP domain-containing protein [Geodermatophilus sp. DF01_2]TFV64685.1 CHAP domain-containing protein [Geodermatophilus sp. DF01_2]